MSPRSKELSEAMRVQSRAALISAARKLFAERGYFNCKVSEIAREAGMSQGNLYWYFDGKEALLKAVLADGFAALGIALEEAAAQPGTALQKIDALVAGVLAFGRERGDFNTIMLSILGHGGDAFFSQLGFDMPQIGLGYTRSVGDLDLQRDVAINPYFQWPISILFHSFLMDVFAVGNFRAVQIGFVFVALSVAGGLFTLWLHDLPEGSDTSRTVFWGIVVYFAGFHWLLNWQAVPYSFSLALFIPMLALYSRRSWQDKVLILLLFVVGLESHALVGVWGPAIVALLVVLGALTHRRKLTISLVLFMAVAQTTLIIYKNSRFFKHLILNLHGYYRAFLVVGGSDRALARYALRALEPLPEDWVGAVLKVLSWLDLALIGVAFALGVLVVIRYRSLKNREIALFGVGAFHFVTGILVVAIGTRSLQLIGLVPAFFVVNALLYSGKLVRSAVLLVSIAGLLLFPSAIVRSHQISGHYVEPTKLLVKDHMSSHRAGLWDTVIIIDEGRIRPTDLLAQWTYNPSTLRFASCHGPYLMVDTLHFRRYVSSVAEREEGEIRARLDELELTASYTNGFATLRIGQDCSDLESLWE